MIKKKKKTKKKSWCFISFYLNKKNIIFSFIVAQNSIRCFVCSSIKMRTRNVYCIHNVCVHCTNLVVRKSVCYAVICFLHWGIPKHPAAVCLIVFPLLFSFFFDNPEWNHWYWWRRMFFSMPSTESSTRCLSNLHTQTHAHSNIHKNQRRGNVVVKTCAQQLDSNFHLLSYELLIFNIYYYSSQQQKVIILQQQQQKFSIFKILWFNFKRNNLNLKYSAHLILNC